MRARKGLVATLMGIMILAIVSNTLITMDATKTISELKGITGGLVTLNNISFGILGQLSSKTHRPDFNKLMNGTVVIHNRKATAGGVCIRKDETYSYILTVAHIIYKSKFKRERGAIRLRAPESNMGHTVRIECIKSFLRSNISEVDPADYPDISLETYAYDKYKVEVIKIDRRYDLALIRIPKEANITPILITEMVVNTGDKVFVCGHPLSVYYHITEGIVSNIHDKVYMIIDAPMTFGSSGGGVYNQYGELIGICVSVPTYFDLDLTEEEK